eukprot:SAG22_NODE_6192_length_887_cov_2.049492_2_plen_90_part_01
MGAACSCSDVSGDGEEPSPRLVLHPNFEHRPWLQQGDWHQHYGETRKLGKGNYGTVYLARSAAARPLPSAHRQLRANTEVAVKTMNWNTM